MRTATFIEPDESKTAHQDNKPLESALSVIAIVNGKMRECIIVRFYRSKSADGTSPVYCNFWLCMPDNYRSGKGVAKGFGYHKQSAALHDAIRNAGIVLPEDIDGRGMSVYPSAFVSILNACGIDCMEESILIVSH